MKDFKYLGSTIQADRDSTKEDGKRIQAGWSSWRKVTGVLCDKKIPVKMKGKLFKTMVRPAMLFGMEAVEMTKKQEKQRSWHR